jgi:EmrB/QacA subfamily drug resistance transporter
MQDQPLTSGLAPKEPAESELEQRRWHVLMLASLGAFMTPLDSSIVAVALPAIGPSLHLSYTEALWVQAAYLLVISILLIPFGRLADQHGLVRFYIAGVIVFGLSSVAAALSLNGPFLIAARCVQGAGGAFMASTSAALVTAVFPPHERGRALGINVMAVYIGLAAGPPLGGLIVTHFGWRWIFLINAPIALATVLSGWTFLGSERRDRVAALKRVARSEADWERHSTSRHIDVAGASILGLMLAALFVPLTFISFWGWASPRTLGLLAVAAVLFIAFVLVEDRVSDPMLDLELLRKNRLFAAATTAALLNYAAVYGVVIFTAVFLEIAQSYSAQRAGLILLVEPVLMAALSPLAGRLSDRLGSRLLATTGMLLVALGMLELALLSVSGPMWRVLLALATVGVGMAAFSAPNTSAVMGSVHRSRLSLASGFLGTMRFTGQGISIALLGAIAASKLGPAGGRVLFLGEAASHSAAVAFAAGYREAMLAGAALAVVGGAISLVRGQKME